MNIELNKNEPQTISVSKNKVIVALCFGILIMIAMNLCMAMQLHNGRGFERGGERFGRGNIMHGNQFNNQYPPMMQGYKLNSQVPQMGTPINAGATSATKVAPTQ